MMDLDGSTNIAIPKKYSAKNYGGSRASNDIVLGAKVQRPATQEAGEDNSERRINKIKKDV